MERRLLFRVVSFFIMEITCNNCGRHFYQESRKGRRPVRCPACRERVKEKWRKDQKEKGKDK